MARRGKPRFALFLLLTVWSVPDLARTLEVVLFPGDPRHWPAVNAVPAARAGPEGVRFRIASSSQPTAEDLERLANADLGLINNAWAPKLAKTITPAIARLNARGAGPMPWALPLKAKNGRA